MHAQASKLTVAQVEIGFDILKARDVPMGVGEADSGAAVSAVSTAGTPSNETTGASSSGGISSASASGENTVAMTTTKAGAGADAGGATAGPSPLGDGADKEVEIVDDRRKRYRLMVKRRLLKRHGEELSADAATRKRQLEELYRDVEADLLRSGAKLRKEREKPKEP